ncbi:MAG TPA: helix-turn-helix transcriptional regulator [Micromonosporaceae bacterium]|nr:helix-turn-helix transcriptional regulator [Micromonosporaceae bacterium]
MQPHPIRITVAVATVLRMFLDDVAQPRYGYELMQVTGFPSGKLYPILARLEAAGWLHREREIIDASLVGRPPRYWYKLTEHSIAPARHELAALRQQMTPATGTAGRTHPEVGLA